LNEKREKNEDEIRKRERKHNIEFKIIIRKEENRKIGIKKKIIFNKKREKKIRFGK
jgi:hypothetical protein